MSDTTSLTILGDKASRPRYDGPNPSMLEAFPLERQGIFVVGLDCLEFTSLCPQTGQPDFAKIYIAYVPRELCVETKSLKFYLTSYRNEGTFYEDCINKIAADIFEVVKPRYMRVYAEYTVRGGVAIKPLVVKVDESQPEQDMKRCLEVIAQFDAVQR
jgi:7-cyano-7-deazaguanine reductase